MTSKLCTVANCIWAENDNFCEVLSRASVPLDGKWPLLILYLRGIQDVTVLSERQKARMQELLISILRQKDYSRARFENVQTALHDIVIEPYQEKLNNISRETSELAKDMRNLFGKYQGNVTAVVQNVDEGLSKGVEPAFLLAGIRDALKDLAVQMEQDTSALVNLSHKDSLTGLSNRRSFDAFLKDCVECWKEKSTPVSLIMFDIDHFKKFNDTYGHLVGDQVLHTLAAQVQKIIAPLESGQSRVLAARFGGEEFAVVLSNEAAAQADKIAEAIRKSVQKTALLLRDAAGSVLESGLRVTVSLGIAEISPHWNGALQTNLVDSADKALYYAKNNGRNCTVHYTPDKEQHYSLISPPRVS